MGDWSLTWGANGYSVIAGWPKAFWSLMGSSVSMEEKMRFSAWKISNSDVNNFLWSLRRRIAAALQCSIRCLNLVMTVSQYQCSLWFWSVALFVSMRVLRVASSLMATSRFTLAELIAWMISSWVGIEISVLDRTMVGFTVAFVLNDLWRLARHLCKVVVGVDDMLHWHFRQRSSLQTVVNSIHSHQGAQLPLLCPLPYNSTNSVAPLNIAWQSRVITNMAWSFHDIDLEHYNETDLPITNS